MVQDYAIQLPRSATSPFLSVVVPTERRQKEIALLVASLARSRMTYLQQCQEARTRAHGIELLLVDSTTPLLRPETIVVWDHDWMRVVPGSRHVRQKRNLGVRTARGEWIAFVDSDCTVIPGYFSAVIKAIEDNCANAFAGRVEFRGEENLVWRVIAATRLISPDTQTQGTGEVAWCATANLIIQKNLFESLGGFDESLPFRLGGDDVDFGLRLHRSGHALRILSTAVVVHPKEPWSKLKAILSRAWRWGRVEYHLALRHPELVRFMPPFFTGCAVTIALTCILESIHAHQLAFLALPLLWLVVDTILSTWLQKRNDSGQFHIQLLAKCLERYYHFGTMCEFTRAGAFRFFWQTFMVEDRMDLLFPSEPLASWSSILATLIIFLLGAWLLQ